MHFADTMDPPSPIRRDLTQEEILEDIIHNAPDDGEGDSSDDGPLTKSGEVYI